MIAAMKAKLPTLLKSKIAALLLSKVLCKYDGKWNQLCHLHSTQYDQEHIISKGQQHAGVAYITLEDDSLTSLWQREAPCPGNFQQQPHWHHH